VNGTADSTAADATGRRRLALSVVIPCYNERDTVEALLDRVHATPFEKQIVVVDDGSTDGTRQILERLKPKYGLELIFHTTNQGKGGAIASGFAAANKDVVVIQDADLEYDPADYAALVKPIEEGKADVVYGSRFLSGTHRCHLFWHYVGNKFLTFVSNVFTNLNLTDMETCYKVFRLDVAKQITIESKRFGVEPELTAKVAKMKCRVYEVPVSYYGRDYAHGKKIRPIDALEALWVIVRFNLFR
jgi:glycosyltransferase involved in cell wall biosynthesis